MQQQNNESELAFLRQQYALLSTRLKEAQKYKSSFLSNMRNELINPFSSILGLSGKMLYERRASKEQMHKALSLIHQETFALDFHLKTIFLASEIESGECYPAPSLIRIEVVVGEVLAAMDHLLRKKNIRLVICQRVEEMLWADPEKVQMILLSLLYHLIMKSTTGEGVSVQLSRKDELLQVELYNSSRIGKDNSLFDMATFQELCLFNDDIEGIHLSVAKAITESLNGNMEADMFEGEMVAFRFSIPVNEGAAGGDLFEEQAIFFK